MDQIQGVLSSNLAINLMNIRHTLNVKAEFWLTNFEGTKYVRE